MASIALEKLEGHLNCSICLDIYQNPKQLQCHHVYCQQCLVKLVFKDQLGQLSLPCPICREATLVPANGVAGFQAAFQVNQLLEIVEQHKQVKDSSVNEENKSKAASSQPEKVSVHCPEHNERGIDLYCKTCEETICFKCIMKDEKHHSHQYEEIDKAFKNYKVELTDLLVPLGKRLTVIEKSLMELNSCKDEVANQEKTLEVDIRRAVSQLHTSLDIRMNELIDRLHSLSQAKFKKLAMQTDRIETIQAQLNSCLQFLVENLEMSNHAEALMMRRGTVEQVQELTASFQDDKLEPTTKADVTFTASTGDLIKECRTYGEVFVVGPPDPSKCSIEKQCLLEGAMVGEVFTAVIATFDSDNHPCFIEKDTITCELTSMSQGTRARGNIKVKETNLYEIDLRPSIKGKHQLHVKLDGLHISGSPYPIVVESPIDCLGNPISTIGNKKGPFGVLVSQQGEVFVTEWDAHCVTVFDSNGKDLRSFGSYSRLPVGGKLFNPHGIATDCKGNVFVADCNHVRVQKFSSSGRFISMLDLASHPRGIAFNAANDLVYVSCVDGIIRILHPDLKYLGRLSSNGSDLGQLDDSRHLACDKAGNVYIADSGNHRVQVFTTEGKFLKVFGGKGSGRGELLMPSGIAIDRRNRIYVSERLNNRISVFNSEGKFVTSFGVNGKGPGEFQGPAGLAFDSDGVLYVCDKGNNRIQLF